MIIVGEEQKKEANQTLLEQERCEPHREGTHMSKNGKSNSNHRKIVVPFSTSFQSKKRNEE